MAVAPAALRIVNRRRPAPPGPVRNIAQSTTWTNGLTENTGRPCLPARNAPKACRTPYPADGNATLARGRASGRSPGPTEPSRLGRESREEAAPQGRRGRQFHQPGRTASSRKAPSSAQARPIALGRLSPLPARFPLCAKCDARGPIPLLPERKALTSRGGIPMLPSFPEAGKRPKVKFRDRRPMYGNNQETRCDQDRRQKACHH